MTHITKLDDIDLINELLRRVTPGPENTLSARALRDLIDKQTDDISIVWSSEDVIQKAKDNGITLSKEQSLVILGNIKNNLDHNYGVTWETLDSEIDSYVTDNPDKFKADTSPQPGM